MYFKALAKKIQYSLPTNTANPLILSMPARCQRKNQLGCIAKHPSASGRSLPNQSLK